MKLDTGASKKDNGSECNGKPLKSNSGKKKPKQLNGSPKTSLNGQKLQHCSNQLLHSALQANQSDASHLTAIGQVCENANACSNGNGLTVSEDTFAFSESDKISAIKSSGSLDCMCNAQITASDSLDFPSHTAELTSHNAFSSLDCIGNNTSERADCLETETETETQEATIETESSHAGQVTVIFRRRRSDEQAASDDCCSQRTPTRSIDSPVCAERKGARVRFRDSAIETTFYYDDPLLVNYPLVRSASRTSTGSRENPFVPDGALSREVEQLISHMQVVRVENARIRVLFLDSPSPSSCSQSDADSHSLSECDSLLNTPNGTVYQPTQSQSNPPATAKQLLVACSQAGSQTALCCSVSNGKSAKVCCSLM